MPFPAKAINISLQMSDNQQYIVSARKYRPVTFASVVGQKNLTATLRNSISTGRLAQAYLFCGPRGVGKTSCARIFARTINCLNPTPEGEACGECESCKAISRGNSFNLIELDAASNNSVDDIRGLIDQVNVPPQMGRYKVFIIDEVHMLSTQAFNAFLKTLEEPPRYAIFILATTEKHKVIPTILSRCQIYDFKRITIDDMVDHLAYVASDTGVKADPRALAVIARKADGAMRDALSIFDQVAASAGGEITYEAAIENLNVLDYDYYFKLVNAFSRSDVPDALLIYKEIRDRGFDSLFFINGLASHIRDLMVAADARTLPLLEADRETAEGLRNQSSSLPLQWYYAAMKILNDCDYNYRGASNKQLLVEVALIRLCQLLKPATPPFDLAEDLPSLRNPAAPVASAPSTASSASQVSAAAPTPKAETAPAKDRQETASEPEPPAQVAPVHARPRPEQSQQPRKTRSHSFRISDIEDNMEASTLEKRSNPFTHERFLEVWAEFMGANPGQHILASAMRVARITRVSDTAYSLILDHPAQVQAIESARNVLIPFLRDKLQNDEITIEAAVDPDIKVIKKLPPQELLKKIVGDNPALAEFLRENEAEIVQ